jgi:hypothetical protein
MPNPNIHAQPPLEFIPSRFNPLVLGVVRSLLPLWRRWRVGVTNIEVSNVETLAKLYEQFQDGKTRFLIAFRHPSTNDPYSMADLLWRQVPQVMRQQGISVKAATHAHFIYDRGIPLWAGKFVGWVYSRLGGTSIRRGKVDLVGLRSVRELFANGQFPMAAAPEGATNGHNEIVSPIEPGIAQFGFWCLEDLHKAGRVEQVLIVPIGIQYRYVEPPWDLVEQLLSKLELESGLVSADVEAESENGGDRQLLLYRRLYRLGEHLLTLMEQFYKKFYGQSFSTTSANLASANLAADSSPDSSSLVPNEQLALRLQALLNAALSVAEQFFDLPPKGNLSDRCRRLEQAGWDRIYREDLKQIESLSPVERGLADRVAEEADLRLWHMRLVETFVSVTGHYVAEKLTVERFAETTLLLWDMVTRIKGRSPFPRPKLGRQHVKMTVGKPISVSEYWEAYQSSRRQAVASLTKELQTVMEEAIATAEHKPGVYSDPR